MKYIKVPESVKLTLLRLYEIILSPLTFIGGLHLKILRRYDFVNLPLSRKILFAVGVFPIRRHFYEPLFHTDDLRYPLTNDRSLPGIDMNVEKQLGLLARFNYNEEILAKFNTGSFDLSNRGFRSGDIDYYYSMIRHFKPRRIIEIGNGFSTRVAMEALAENKKDDPAYEFSLTSIDPYPFVFDNRIRVIKSKVEEVPLDLFKQLKANDILFVDSSHMIRPQGDVLYEMLEILPSLNDGVIVQVHDIFTPKDYPNQWVLECVTLFNEQYMFEAFMSYNSGFEVIGACHYLFFHHHAQLIAKSPLLAANPGRRPPQSFWIKKHARAAS